MLYGIDEPSSYDQAVKEEAWKQAMKIEIDAIERNNTWKLEELPAGHKPIGLKWVYKLKRDTNGEVIKNKARLVAIVMYKNKVLISKKCFLQSLDWKMLDYC